VNPRIRELILEAGFPTFGKMYVVSDGEELERFAELIVQECLDQCYNRGMNDELYTGQLKAASYIEQHFGVGE
jgi:hypothetical protein